jgi:hypothetical protein
MSCNEINSFIESDTFSSHGNFTATLQSVFTHLSDGDGYSEKRGEAVPPHPKLAAAKNYSDLGLYLFNKSVEHSDFPSI